MKSFSENRIRNYIINHWKEIMPEGLYFYKKDYEIIKGRKVDLLCYIFKNNIKIPFLIEIKKSDNYRDILMELSKIVEYNDIRESNNYNKIYIVLLAEKECLYDKTVEKYCNENNIKIMELILDGYRLEDLKVRVIDNIF